MKKFLLRILYPPLWKVKDCASCDSKTYDGHCPKCIHANMRNEK